MKDERDHERIERETREYIARDESRAGWLLLAAIVLCLLFGAR